MNMDRQSNRYQNTNRPAKDYVAFLCGVAVCGLGIYQGLQLVGIAGLVTVLCVLYKPVLSRGANIALALLGRASRAKYRDFEMDVSRTSLSVIADLPDLPPWARGVLSAMEPGHLGLLLAVSKAERMPISGGTQQSLRDLRNLGLIEHDRQSLSGSSYVWLNSAGRDLLAAIDLGSGQRQAGSRTQEVSDSTV